MILHRLISKPLRFAAPGHALFVLAVSLVAACAVVAPAWSEQTEEEEPERDKIVWSKGCETERCREQKLEYHAPVWFFHPDERVFPIAVQALEEQAWLTVWAAGEAWNFHKLGRGELDQLGREQFWRDRRSEIYDWEPLDDRQKAFREKALGRLERAMQAVSDRRGKVEGLALDLRAVDLASFAQAEQQRLEHESPGELAGRVPQPPCEELAGLEPRPPCNNPWTCYAHLVEGVRLPDPLGRRGEAYRSKLRRPSARMGGTYDVLYYFLYFPFNDATNVHEGDWDAAVAVAHPLPDATPDRPVLAVFFSHESSIALSLRPAKPELPTAAYLHEYERWISLPEKTWEERFVYAYGDGHPLIYVSRGSHAAYPIPGFTEVGIEIVLSFLIKKLERRIPFGFDAHPLGLEILSATEDWPPKASDGADFEARPRGQPWADAKGIGHRCKPKELRWGEPEWTRFPGRWGEISPFEGWSGPHGFLQNERVVDAGHSPRLAAWARHAAHPLDTVEVYGFGGRLVHLPSTHLLHLEPKEEKK